MATNSHQWEAYNKYIDELVKQQHKILEQASDNITMYRSQGAVASLQKLKKLKDEILKNE